MLSIFNTILNTLIRNVPYSLRIVISLLLFLLAILSIIWAIKPKDDKADERRREKIGKVASEGDCKPACAERHAEHVEGGKLFVLFDQLGKQRLRLV